MIPTPRNRRGGYGRGNEALAATTAGGSAACAAAAGNITQPFGALRRDRRGGRQHSDLRHLDDSMYGHRAHVSLESAGDAARAGRDGALSSAADHSLRAAG